MITSPLANRRGDRRPLLLAVLYGLIQGLPFGIEAIRSLNTQGETNLHNLRPFQKKHLLHLGGGLLGLALGSANWLVRPTPLLPDRRLSLYFLIPGLWSLAFNLTKTCFKSGSCSVMRPDHQEVDELLISLGLYLHSRRS